MGFQDAKRKVLDCLRTGKVRHEERNNIDTKNLYAIGVVTTDQVIDIIKKARGDNYSSSPHDFDRSIEVHILKFRKKTPWYIKWYFVEPNTVFISLHE